MPPLPNILPMTGADPLPGNGAIGLPAAPGGTAGQFDELMTRALSPAPNGNDVPPGQNQTPQISPKSARTEKNDPNKIPGQLETQNEVMTDLTRAVGHVGNPLVSPKSGHPDQKTSDKTAAKSGDGNSDADKNSAAPTDTASITIYPAVIPNPLLATVVSSLNPVGVVKAEILSNASSAQPPTKAADKPVPIPAVTSGTKSMPITGTKILIPSLADNQMASVVKSFATGKMNPAAAKNTSPPEPNLKITTTVDQTNTDLSKTKVVSEPEKSSTGESDLSDKTAGQAQPAASGISIAKQDMPMNQAEKTNKIAGLMEQVLPGNAVSAPHQNSSPLFLSRPEQFMSTVATTAVTPSSPASGNTSITAALPVDSAAAPATDDARDRTLERTQDLVTLNAVRLSDSGNNSLQVVIKPGAGTELSLELRQHGDHVEVHAVLQQGDFNHLNQQWPDLQHRLDQRGIRLAPLTDNGASANNNGGETFQQKQNQPAETFAEFAFAGAATGMSVTAAARTPAHRGWETWA